MDFEEIINKIEKALKSSWKVPMSGGRYAVDIDEIESLINELRNSVPRDVEEARKILQRKEQIIQTAKNNCEEIYKVAKQKVNAMVEDHEIVKLAKQREAELTQKLIRNSKDMIYKSNASIAESLNALERLTLSTLEKIRVAKGSLKNFK